ncbi:hypothetical protein E4L98_20700 [Duganella callida]|uniref:Hemerythrin-like domain-containing protein n=1 Tax=Duganella callida TaxID=2561932 RepID=A0A4Y9SCC6_9BURK|nr:hypothetical protein E4L98_20700 [Duganella callida]
MLSFQKYVRNTLMQQNSLTLSQLEYACENLNTLYQAFHWRKTEMYLIPAMREASERAGQLLDELNRLNQSALTAIRLLQDKLGALAEVRDDQVSEVCDSIDGFCTALLKRLEKEEQELFGLARQAIAGETWFSIANQLMMHDKHLDEMKRSGLPPVEAARVAARRRALPDGEADERQISIPGLQVLPVVQLDEAPAPSSRAAVRHKSHDDVIMK